MESKWYVGALSLILSFSIVADNSPELDEFEIIEGNDSATHIWAVAHDRKFKERLYCIRGVEYIFEEGYIILLNRDGIPFPCDRVQPDTNGLKIFNVND